MQFAKDSFFLALQSRLAGLNPARTVTINGATVPAVLVVENLPPSLGEAVAEHFLYRVGRGGCGRWTCGEQRFDDLKRGDFVLHVRDRYRAAWIAGGGWRNSMRNCWGFVSRRIRRSWITRSLPARTWGRECFGDQPEFTEGKGAGLYWGRVTFPRGRRAARRMKRRILRTRESSARCN